MKKDIKFEDYKTELQEAIKKRANQAIFSNEKDLNLIDGFILQPIQQTIGNSIIVGGPQVPLVAVVGVSSGKVYYFAVKALLPDLDF